jgi:hypothetical protein
MRLLIPVAAIGAILWLVSSPAWQHATHGKQMGAVVLVAVVGVVLEVIVTVLRRRPGRPASSYATPARRR